MTEKPKGRKYRFINLIDGRPITHGWGETRGEAEKDALKRNEKYVKLNQLHDKQEAERWETEKKAKEEAEKKTKKEADREKKSKKN